MSEPRIPWIWEVIPGYNEAKGYRWVTKNVVMHNDETGVTIRYHRRTPDHVICGARTVHPGYPNAQARDWKGRDYRQPYDVVCNIVGDHAEMPHVGVDAICADMACDCKNYGSFHLVIVGMTFSTPTPKAEPRHQIACSWPDDECMCHRLGGLIDA